MRTRRLWLHAVFVTSMLSAGPVRASLLQSYSRIVPLDSPSVLSLPADLTAPISSGLSTMRVIRPMRVSVTPTHPEPFEQVSVTISGETSDPYLTLGTITVDRQGTDITIDLDWLTFRPLAWSGSVCQAIGSAGYGIEQINPLQSGVVADESYEITQSLGSFDEGTYWIHVYSHGAFEGKAWATFRVRAPLATFSNLMDVDWPW